MASVNSPSSFSADNYRYKTASSGWLGPTQYDMIAAGETSGGDTYKAYMVVPGISSTAVITAVTLHMYREYDGYTTAAKTWDIGLMTGAPATSVTTANFSAMLGDNYVLTNQSWNSLSISPATWGTPNQTKYIVFLGYSTSSNCYAQLLVNSGTYPYVTIEYLEGTAYYGTGGAWQKCLVYYGSGGQWVQCIPYFGSGGGWHQIGG